MSAARMSSLILVFHFIIAGLNVVLYTTFAAAVIISRSDESKCPSRVVRIAHSIIISVDELSMLVVLNIIRKKSVQVKASLSKKLTRLNSV